MGKKVSFRELAKSWPFEAHLDFEKRLRNAASQWFKNKGYETQRCGYILAEYNDWHKNIISQEVADYIKSERDKRANNRQGFPLHKYIHHGLSSQAMLFNLVGPLIMTEKQDLSPLKDTFEKNGICWPEGRLKAKFEDEDRNIFNEMTQQPTSIDLVIENENKVGGIYIEFKFVEHEFGGCSVFKNGDCDGRNPAKDRSSCYLHHIQRKYWELLDIYEFLKGPIAENATCFLANYYQFFREVLYAFEKKGTFVLLVDQRNPTFCSGGNCQRGLFPFLKGFVPTELKDKVHMVGVQEVVKAIKESREYSWIIEFQQKYGIE
jgi:POLQ-like helicase